MGFTVRSVCASDVDAVVALVRATLAEFGLGFGDGSTTDTPLYDLPASYVDHGGCFLVACEDSGALIGTAGIFPVAPGVYELRKMYLHPAARGRGVGAQLWAECLAFCHKRGARQVVLDTLNNMTDAIAFYERRGFVRDDAQIRGSRCSRGYRLDLAPPAGAGK